MQRELILCAHCRDAGRPLTESNAVSLMNWFQRDADGNEVCNARVHRECADAWAKANGGNILNPEATELT
jgi:hypothetical protein